MLLKNLINKLYEPKSFNSGWLPQADGHKVFFAEYGNPKGKPVLITHGGPGGCVKPMRARLFDLKKYRVIMFDQRGCGKSLPFGELRHNTTEDILFDMRRLLEYLNIKHKVILQGGSWASTLMLLFAERNPDKVEKMLLSQIFLADEIDEKWMEEQCSLFYPDIVEELRKPMKKWQKISEYYFDLLMSDDKVKQKKALSMYGCFERQLGNLNPCFSNLEFIDEKDLAYTRIYAQFSANSFGIKNNEIMRNIKKIKHIPTLIVHNRLDMVCPVQGAYKLAKNLDNAKLVIVPEKGHVGDLLHKTIKQEIKKFL